MIVNVRGQDRRFIHCVGANTGFVAADLDAVLDHAPRVLHIGYFLILPRLDAGELAQQFARARQAGTITVLDVATPGPGNYLEPLKVVLPQTDVFVPNADEAELILGETDPVRQAHLFHGMGAQRVVITRGEQGVVSVSDGLRVKLGAYPISFVDGFRGWRRLQRRLHRRPTRRPDRDRVPKDCKRNRCQLRPIRRYNRGRFHSSRV